MSLKLLEFLDVLFLVTEDFDNLLAVPSSPRGPLASPRAFCCFTKKFPESPATFLVTVIIIATMMRVVIVSGIFRISILTKTLTIVMALFSTCGILWLII